MNYSEMLFNRDEKIIKIIEEKDKEINKLTAESTEWEERTYCWQDRAENLQIVLDKIKEYCKEVIKEHNNGEYNVSTTQLAIQEHKDNIENILKLLEEIE